MMSQNRRISLNLKLAAIWGTNWKSEKTQLFLLFSSIDFILLRREEITDYYKVNQGVKEQKRTINWTLNYLTNNITEQFTIDLY